ncbi:MAG: hypothetical protein L0922_05580, partial [Candidatus Mariimomonas ferrooxydans]
MQEAESRTGERSGYAVPFKELWRMIKIKLRHKGKAIEVTPENYKDIAKGLCLSYSIIKRHLEMSSPIIINGKLGLYDIETDRDIGKFILGYVNGKLFTDPKEMVDNLSGYDVIAGFNSYRFDNENLFRECPESFETVRMSGFDLHKVRGCLNLDLLPAFMLWKPFLNGHSGQVLGDELGFKRKHDLSNPAGKCQEDIQIMRMFWPYARQIFETIDYIFGLDPETLSSTYHRKFGYSKLRRWFMQSWMIRMGIYPELVKRDSPKKPTYYLYHKKGFYTGINVFDIKSAYPFPSTLPQPSLTPGHSTLPQPSLTPG